MFQFVKVSPWYAFPVVVELLNEDGITDRHDFSAHFKRFSEEELNDLSASLKDNATTDTDFVKRVLVGWDGVMDETDAPLPFTDENLYRLLQVHGTAYAISKAFWDSLWNNSKASVLEKN